MTRYFILSLLLTSIAVPCGAEALVGKETAPTTTAKETPPATEKNLESEPIVGIEPAAATPAPQQKIDTKTNQDKEFSRGRMAFLFGNYETAYKIWKPLADQDYAKAQATLGWMYHTGKGVKKDLSIAFSWYEKAAQKNHPVAQNNLGVFYEQGLHVDKNASKAAKWYKEAAEWGYSFAQYNLGMLYLEGRGVKKDEKEAQYWLQIAALQGVQQAVQALQTMSVSAHGADPGKAPVAGGEKKPAHSPPHGSSQHQGTYDRIK